MCNTICVGNRKEWRWQGEFSELTFQLIIMIAIISFLLCPFTSPSTGPFKTTGHFLFSVTLRLAIRYNVFINIFPSFTLRLSSLDFELLDSSNYFLIAISMFPEIFRNWNNKVTDINVYQWPITLARYLTYLFAQ